jgi:hypothetical protein
MLNKLKLLTVFSGSALLCYLLLAPMNVKAQNIKKLTSGNRFLREVKELEVQVKKKSRG